MPNSAQFVVERVELRRAPASSTTARPRGSVGVEWSIVATVRSGRRTVRPRAREPGERLRRGHLVDEVQIDVEDRRAARLLGDDVRVPDLLEQRALVFARLASDVGSRGDRRYAVAAVAASMRFSARR